MASEAIPLKFEVGLCFQTLSSQMAKDFKFYMVKVDLKPKVSVLSEGD